MRTKQCAKCPWRTDVDPHDIPNGYCEAKHAGLDSTIAEPGDVAAVFSGEVRIMACHETHKDACVGYLHNQLGPGNNIALRMWFSDQVRKGKVKKRLEVIGEQHETFEDTLP